MTTFQPTAVPTPAETDHALQLRLRPGAVLPCGRLRPGLFATIEVLDGSIAMAVAGEDMDVTAGAVVDVDPGADLAVWNTGPGTARVRATLRLPAGLRPDDLQRALVATESLFGLGSARDATGRAGDGVLRFAVERELEDLADLVRAPAARPLAAAA